MDVHARKTGSAGAARCDEGGAEVRARRIGQQRIREGGMIFEGGKRFNVVIRLDDRLRADINALRQVPVAKPWGAFVPLDSVAALDIVQVRTKSAGKMASAGLRWSSRPAWRTDHVETLLLHETALHVDPMAKG